VSDHPLNVLEGFFRRFAVLPNETDYSVITLWIAHTFYTDTINTTPRLAIISPEYGCGKSRVLEVLQELCFKGEKLDHFTRSYLMRTVDQVRTEFGKSPTLLVDELDAVWGRKGDEGEAIRAFVNSGYRDSGFYGITEGEGKNRKATKFRTFSPMALAGKGEIIPESVATRGITIRLQRRKEDQQIENFLSRKGVLVEAEEIREWLTSWADQTAQDLNFNLEMSVTDRDREVWSPLFMIAELAGEEWVEKAEMALTHYMTSIQDDSVPRERQLLSDTQEIISRLGEDKIRTATLLSELVSLPDSEWGKLNYGNAITEKYIAKRLKTYGITPRNLRFGENTFKGYLRFEVEKACAIYLPAHSKSDTADTADTELNFVAPVAGKADLEDARWFDSEIT
jgi:hypothetical protein